MADTDWGLLGGLAEGIKSGFESYRKEKQDIMDRAMKRRLEQLQLAKEGYQISPTDESLIEMTPEAQQKKKYETGLYDPTSEASKNARLQARGLLKAAGAPDVESIIPEGATAKDILGESSLYGKAITGIYGMKGREMATDRFQRGYDIKEQSLALRRGEMASKAGQAVEHDPIVMQAKKTNNSLDRALSMMKGNVPITAKNFAILQQDMINAMAPGGAATEGKVNREMVETLAGHLNDLQLKFGQVKDLRKEQPEIFNQLRQLIENIKEDYSTALANQVKDVAGSYKYVDVQPVQKTIQEKLQRYAPEQEGLIHQGPTLPSQIPENERMEAMDFIKKNPTSPKAMAMKKALGIK